MDTEAGIQQEEPDDLMLSIRRLARVALDNLEDGIKERLFDATERRLHILAAQRVLKLYREIRADSHRDHRRFEKQLAQLEKSVVE